MGFDLRAEVEVLLEQGQTYLVTVTAINSAGLLTTSSSNGVKIDISPPSVNDFGITSTILINKNIPRGKITRDIVAVSTNKWNISGTWKSVIDNESDIKRISVCATTIEETCNLLEWHDLNPDSLVFSLDFPRPLQSGTVLVLKLQAENRAGLKTMVNSGKVLVDNSPPVEGFVKINGKESLVLLHEKQPLVASWLGFKDFETDIEKYQYRICSADNIADCVSKFVGVGLRNSVVLKDIEINHGKEYQFVLKAINFAKLETVAVSNPFMLDETTPQTGLVFNGLYALVDVLYQSSPTQISANWKGFRDKDSGISVYEICIGSVSGLCDVSELKNVGLADSAIVTNLHLIHNATYYTTVRATNGAGQSAFASSSGLLIDLTPPTGGKLRDGDDFDTDVTAQDLFVSSNWDEFHDSESGISKYVVCAGTMMGSCDVAAPTTVNNDLAAKLEVWPAISAGTVVYSTLWAYNEGGGMTVVYSDGVLVDTTPPNSGTVSIKSCH